MERTLGVSIMNKFHATTSLECIDFALIYNLNSGLSESSLKNIHVGRGSDLDMQFVSASKNLISHHRTAASSRLIGQRQTEIQRYLKTSGQVYI